MYDRETGYYYLMSRYYNPTISRFVNADTADILFEEEDNIVKYNLYAYCYNNLVNMNDDSGESPSNVIVAIIGGLAGYALGVAIAKELGLKGSKRVALIASASLGGAALGAFLGPYVAKYGKKISTIVKNMENK